MENINKIYDDVQKDRIDNIIDGIDSMDCWFVNFKSDDVKNQLYFKVPRKPSRVCRRLKVSLMLKNAETTSDGEPSQCGSFNAYFRYNTDNLEYMGFEKARETRNWTITVNKENNRIRASGYASEIGIKSGRLVYIIFHVIKADNSKLEFEDVSSAKIEDFPSGKVHDLLVSEALVHIHKDKTIAWYYKNGKYYDANDKEQNWEIRDYLSNTIGDGDGFIDANTSNLTFYTSK